LSEGHLNGAPDTTEIGEDEEDINSYMYQTVGHGVIPLYADALGLPLYRQDITGTAINTDKTYAPSSLDEGDDDETEDLIPLIRKVMAAHPTANALSSGAILSDYQRTRVESVAIRLGLVPLSYLWQYPYLPPGLQTSLLEDMAAVGQEAMIIKVASGDLMRAPRGNVADEAVKRRMVRSMERFGGLRTGLFWVRAVSTRLWHWTGRGQYGRRESWWQRPIRRL
jgi:diphthine-ammonia ligase